MTLDALIRGAPKTQPVGSATAATEEGGRAGTVAVAGPWNAKTEGNSAHPDDLPLWWRVSITEPGARTVEVDTPSGYTLTDWQAYADRYHGPGCAVTALAGLPKPRAPVNLNEALRTACEGVAGISPEVFRSLMSPEDLDDIAAGDIAVETLHGYAQSFAEGMRSGRLVRSEAPATAEQGAVPFDDAIPRA